MVEQLGLDNGVCLRVRHKINFDEMKDNGEMPYFLNFDMNDWASKDGDYEYEICYWRKWWGFRDSVIDELRLPSDCGSFDMTIEQIEHIRAILIEWLAGKNGYEISTIWQFDELVEHIGWDIAKLSWLIEYMQENAGNCLVQFYDSY